MRETTLVLLEHYGGPGGMRRSGRSVGEWDKSAGLRRCGGIIDDLFDAIGQQSVTVAGTQTIEEIAPVPSSHIRQLREQREQLAAKVEALLEDHPLLTVLTSMPAIAVRTASQILLSISGDITRFKSAAHQAAYAGIAPVTRRSGTSIHGKPRHGEATNASRTPYGTPPSSPRSTIPKATPTANANATKANATTRPSSASHDDAATSSTACSRTQPSTSPCTSQPEPPAATGRAKHAPKTTRNQANTT